MGTEWVAVGLSRDLPAGVAMPALWQGRELAVWRSASGKLSAWDDRCPPRGMRLSHGFVGGGALAGAVHPPPPPPLSGPPPHHKGGVFFGRGGGRRDLGRRGGCHRYAAGI